MMPSSTWVEEGKNATYALLGRSDTKKRRRNWIQGRRRIVNIYYSTGEIGIEGIWDRYYGCGFMGSHTYAYRTMPTLL